MNKITKDNYEAFLLDLSEGNLSDELQLELELFFMQYPELSKDIITVESIFMDENEKSFNHKNELKKSIHDLVSEYQFISYVEHQLTNEEKQVLEKSCLLNRELEKELNAYKFSKLTPDLSVIYPHKEKLKYPTKIIWFNFSVKHFAAAASVLLLISLILLWSSSKLSTKENMIVSNQNKDNLLQKTTVYKENSPMQKPPKTINALKPIHKSISEPLMKYSGPVNHTKQVVTSKIASSVNSEASLVTEKTLVSELTANDSVMNLSIPITINKIKPKQQEEVVTEYEEEKNLGRDKDQKTVWAIVGKTLKKLNQVGIKSVDGEEERTKHTTTYDLNIGGFSIKHKTAAKL